MKLHLATIGDTSLKYLENKYLAPTGPLSMDQLMEKKNHNIMMIDIASTLNYVEFDEVKDFPIVQFSLTILINKKIHKYN